MKKYLLGTKQGMSQYYTDAGLAIPVTVISAGPVTVTQIKDADKDGYNAVQVGYGTQQTDRINKARLGQMKEIRTIPSFERI